MPTLLAAIPRLAVHALLAFVLGLPVGAAAERIKGSGVTKTETRQVSGFHRITLGVTADVEVRQGASEGLTITGDDNVVARVETVVDDGTLRIRWKDRNTEASYERLRVTIDARDVDDLTIGGAGSIHAARLDAPAFKATLGGSGRVTVDDLRAKSVGVTLAGSGEAKLAGRAESLDATLAGSGQLAAARLDTRRARLTLQGSGRAEVRASDNLDVTIAGSGEVVYHGKPAVRQSVLGQGRITAAAP